MDLRNVVTLTADYQHRNAALYAHAYTIKNGDMLSLHMRFCTVCDYQEFLLEIQSSPNVEYGELADILVNEAQSADEVTRMTALRWLRAFVIQAKDQLMPYYAVILAAVLPNVSHNNQDICQVRLVSELCLQCLHFA